MSATSATEDEERAAWDPNMLPPAGQKAELVLLAVESMRARRRPLPILALWAWQTLLAALVAWPAATAVAAWYGSHPSGDAPLWQPGGLPLVDLAFVAEGARAETLTLAGLVFLVAGFADLVPLAALLASMGYVTRDRSAPPMREAIARGAAAFPTFASLFAMASLAEGLLVGIAFLIALEVSEALVKELGEARADQTAWLLASVVLAMAGVVGVMHDLARAAAVRFRVKALRSWRFAFNALSRAPAAVLWGWAWRALAGWALVVVGGLVAARFGGRGGGALAVVFVTHQLVLLVRVAFRASWLAKALRAIDRAHRVVGRRRKAGG